MKKIFVIFALIVACTYIYVHSTQKEVESLAKRPDSELMKSANRFIEKEEYDSALRYLSIIIGNLDEKTSRQDRQLAVNAYLGKWFIYSVVYNNHSKAYENLYNAMKMSETDGFPLSRIYLNYGCTYLTLATPYANKDLNHEAYNYLKKAFDLARNERNADVFVTAFINLATVSSLTDSVKAIENLYRRFAADTLGNDHPLRKFGQYYYQGLTAIDKKQYASALEYFRRQSEIVAHDPEWTRPYIESLSMQADALFRMGNVEKAIATLDKAQALSESFDIKDARLVIYKQKLEIFSETGDKSKADAFRKQYYELKDSLLNYQHVINVKSFDLHREIDNLEIDMLMLKEQKQRRNIVIIAITAVSIIITVFMIIIYLKNRALTRNNRMLYRKSIEAIKREENERKLRLELQKEKDNALATSSSENVKDKYLGSTLDQTDIKEIMKKTEDVIAEGEEIFSSDFSLQTLADMTGVNYKNLSQAINETTHSNFNNFINDIRVNEACRRIGNPDYSNYTLETIGNSVGFKTRQTFITAFKRRTGLTPSAWQKIMKAEKQRSTGIESNES